MKFLINIATRRRPQQLAELLFNVRSTISGNHPYQILLKIDVDDHSYSKMNFSGITVLRPPAVSKIFATNYGVGAQDFECVINLSDDQRFSKPSWDDALVKLIRSVWPEGTDFYVHLNDFYVAHRLATMDVKGREYYDRDGYIYHPSYNSVSCDAENLFVAMLRGRHHYFPEVLFKHLHPANTKTGRNDDTYTLNHQYDQIDTDNYFKRMAANFHVDGDLKAAIAIIEGYEVKDRWPATK